MKLSYTIANTLLGVALLAGCQSTSVQKKETVRYDEFPSNYPKGYSVKAAADAQAAVGNRNDATLRASHFDGVKLNSLGEAKLASMLKSDRSNNNVTIYVDAPNDDTNAGRKSAIKAFLKTHGVTDTAIALKDGANPTAGSAMAARSQAALEEMHGQNASAGQGSASK